jgi:ferredoxin
MMTYVVTAPCRECKYTDCVVVCPVECFYQDESMLYIKPTDCIDCGACVPECPVEAIYFEKDVPEKWVEYVALNAEKTRGSATNITEKQEPLKGAGCSG